MASLQLIGVFAATTTMLSGCGGGTTSPNTTPSIDTTTTPRTATTTTTTVPTKTIFGLLQFNKHLSILATAVDVCELVERFSGFWEYDVFAPVNSAFESLGDDALSCLLAPVGLPTLTSVLNYHTILSPFTRKELWDGEEIPTLDGREGGTQTIMVGVADGNITLNKKVKVTSADIEATNGVIHEVDSLLIPPNFEAPNCGKEGSIADLVVATPILKTFWKMVDSLRDFGLVDIFNRTWPPDIYTVFAPTDTAFAALGDACVATLTKQSQALILYDILEYHIVDGYDLAADIYDGLQVPTRKSGGKLKFAVAADGAVTIDGSSKVVAVDNYATNGVVHMIDAVLIPPGWANPCAGESNTVVV